MKVLASILIVTNILVVLARILVILTSVLIVLARECRLELPCLRLSECRFELSEYWLKQSEYWLELLECYLELSEWLTIKTCERRFLRYMLAPFYPASVVFFLPESWGHGQSYASFSYTLDNCA